jgi:GNAT superfamily N-acetyltransferase
LTIREGRQGDAMALLTMVDGAIAWMVARGQAMQWGTEPASERPIWHERVQEWVTCPGLRIAEVDDQLVGASVLAPEAPPHVPPSEFRESYLLFLISDRRYAGSRVGAALVERAAADALAVGSEVLRVDCWAGAPDLVAWYERQGFVRSDTFVVNVRGDWHGQVLEMHLDRFEANCAPYTSGGMRWWPTETAHDMFGRAIEASPEPPGELRATAAGAADRSPRCGDPGDQLEPRAARWRNPTNLGLAARLEAFRGGNPGAVLDAQREGLQELSERAAELEKAAERFRLTGDEKTAALFAEQAAALRRSAPRRRYPDPGPHPTWL